MAFRVRRLKYVDKDRRGIVTGLKEASQITSDSYGVKVAMTIKCDDDSLLNTAEQRGIAVISRLVPSLQPDMFIDGDTSKLEKPAMAFLQPLLKKSHREVTYTDKETGEVFNYQESVGFEVLFINEDKEFQMVFIRTLTNVDTKVSKSWRYNLLDYDEVQRVVDATGSTFAHLHTQLLAKAQAQDVARSGKKEVSQTNLPDSGDGNMMGTRTIMKLPEAATRVSKKAKENAAALKAASAKIGKKKSKTATA